MNTILLSILLIISDLIELTYDLGIATRKYVLPAVIYVGVGIYHYTLIGWDMITSQELTLKAYRTPVTTGLAHC